MKPCKHKFEARYDEVYSTVVTDIAGLGMDFKTQTQATLEPYLKTKTYVNDICVKCGERRARL